MKILLALGIPDGMTMQQLRRQDGRLRLAGNSGLTDALSPHLQQLGWSQEVRILGRSGPLKPSDAQVLVNLIGDASVQRQGLERIDAWAATGMPIVNPAAVVRACSREQLPQSLDAAPGLVVPRTSLIAAGSKLAEQIQRLGHRYPLLLRQPGTHGSRSLIRVETPGDLPDTAQTWIVSDFHDSRGADGLYRKRRLIAIGDQLFRRHQLATPDWNVRGEARRHMFRHPALIEEERAFMAGTADGPAERAVAEAFAQLGVDFAVCDYAVDNQGRALIFELNPCFQLTGSLPAQSRYDWRYLEASNPAILSALTDLIQARATAS